MTLNELKKMHFQKFGTYAWALDEGKASDSV